MATFTIYRGDTSPALRFALSPETVDLAGAAVVFNMRGRIARAPAAIVTASPPVVEYAWAAGDTDLLGLYPAEFEVTFPGGAVETYRNCDDGGDLVVNIIADLG